MGQCEQLRELFYSNRHGSGRLGNSAHCFHTFVKAILEPLAKDPAITLAAGQLQVQASRLLAATDGVTAELRAEVDAENLAIRAAARSKAKTHIAATRKRPLQLDSSLEQDLGSAGVQGRPLDYYTIFGIVAESTLEACHLRGKGDGSQAPEVTEALLRGWTPLVGECDEAVAWSPELLLLGRFWGRKPEAHEDSRKFTVVWVTWVCVALLHIAASKTHPSVRRYAEALHYWYIADSTQVNSGELHVAKTMLAQFKNGISENTVQGGTKEVGECAANDLYQTAGNRLWAKDTWKARCYVRDARHCVHDMKICG